MDIAQFWRIIEVGLSPNNHAGQLAAIEAALAKCSSQELFAFQTILEERLVEAFTVDLWGAADLMNGGCSDDSFLYFRLWLISRGKAVFEAAVAHPDSLAQLGNVPIDELDLEELICLAAAAYLEKCDAELPHSEVKWPDDPCGQPWDYVDEVQVKRRLPQLAAIYWEE